MSKEMIYDEQGNFSNTPIDCEYFHTIPLAASMGGEIVGLDVSHIDDRAFEAIANALYHHKMIYFRNQDLTCEAQENLTLRFGEFGTDAYTQGLEGHPNIQPVVKEADAKTKMVFGGGWHTDSPFLEQPPSISLLYAIQTPPYGGDTIWYNSALAYENLSSVMKEMIRSLRVHMSGEKVVASLKGLQGINTNNQNGGMWANINESSMIQGSYHPLVRTHPVSGEKALFVDKVYAKGFEGMPSYESAPLINFLVGHITQEVFSCRLRWSDKTLCLWDNRLCLHRAFNDYDGFRRVMYRTTVKGEIPS